MDESSDQPEVQSGSSLVPLVLAVLALIVGASGVYFGYTAAKNANMIKDQLASEQGKSLESVAALEQQLETLATDFKAVQTNLEAIKSRMRMDRESSSRAMTEIAEEIALNREQINQNTTDIAEIPEQVMVTTPPPTQVANRSPAEEESSPPVEARDGELIHTIASGDTLAKLASQYGVSLSSIQAANPTVDPRRLQIGQKVRIPSN